MLTSSKDSQDLQVVAAEDEDIQQYLPWARNCEDGQEHVSYTTFVEEFDLQNQEHSQQLYANLIRSNHIKRARRIRLSKQYSTFSKQHLDQFWANRLLNLERKKNRVHAAITAAKTSRLAQDASVFESTLGFQYYKECESSATLSEVTSSTRTKSVKSFTKKKRLSLENRYRTLGEKWVLASGTVVEDVLFSMGSDEECTSLSPIHSFMLDLDDVKTKALFSENDWKEIVSDLPPYEKYGKQASEYLDKCMEVTSLEGMRKILDRRQSDPECKVIYHCMDQWEEILSSDPLPFPVAAQLGETWWKDNAWGACQRLTTGVKDAFILTGEKTSHDSSERRNQDITVERKKVGNKADFLWRTISSPDIDWSVGESATVWDPASMKYRNEGVFKLPRQLHNILIARTFEVGGVDSLRHEYVCGLLTGGPVIQRVQICWGSKGENITRFFRSPERRLLSNVQELGTSLMAMHDLLILRATTLRLCRKYEQRRLELARAVAKERRKELLFPSVSPTEKKRKFSLLSSSP